MRSSPIFTVNPWVRACALYQRSGLTTFAVKLQQTHDACGEANSDRLDFYCGMNGIPKIAANKFEFAGMRCPGVGNYKTWAYQTSQAEGTNAAPLDPIPFG